MDAGHVRSDEGVAVPLVVVAVRVEVAQIKKIAKRGIAIDMVVGGPGGEQDAYATEAVVVDDLVVVQVVVAGALISKYPADTVHRDNVVIHMRVIGLLGEE